MLSDALAALHLILAEGANVLRRSAFGVRRSALAGEVSADDASLAHQDILSMPFGLFPYVSFAWPG